MKRLATNLTLLVVLGLMATIAYAREPYRYRYGGYGYGYRAAPYAAWYRAPVVVRPVVPVAPPVVVPAPVAPPPGYYYAPPANAYYPGYYYAPPTTGVYIGAPGVSVGVGF